MSNLTENIATAQEWVAKARSITVLTGAGVSAASGISTYRDDDGLWNKFRAEDFSSVEAFAKDPATVWNWYHERRQIMGHAEPNEAHKALAKMEDGCSQFMLLTQNIDGLHQRAGSLNVVELHGSVWVLRCTQCLGTFESRQALTGLPKCDSCHSLARPAVVWFGESLDPNEWHRAVTATYCDVFIVVGTSALVHPVAKLPFMAQDNLSRVIEINKEETELTAHANLSLIGDAGEILTALTDLPILPNMAEMDLTRAFQRGLEKFYAKFPELRSKE